jgi:hypothetical protein
MNVFERKEGGPYPVLIVDGHESRLNIDFLTYINDPSHKWFVSLGVLYATNYWQVGDSAEQNGHFKMVLSNAKRQLTSFKSDHAMPISISYEDVIPLINKAWPVSFGQVTTNRKAIADCGWYPPNRNLLLHKEITDVGGEPISILNEEWINNGDNTIPMSFNFTDGPAGTCFEKVLQYRDGNGGIARNQQAMQDGQSILHDLENGRRLTSGFMVARGEHSLNNPIFLQSCTEKRKNEEIAEHKKKKKQRRDLQRRISAVETLRFTKPCISEWNSKDCAIYMRYKKRKGDLAMPKSIHELRHRCSEISGRESPDISLHLSDDDANEIFGTGESDYL